jgi:hypothetical protein
LEFETSYWDQRYKNGGDSGAGSQPVIAAKKAALLSRLPWISSVVEIGCGDFQFGRRVMEQFHAARYWGYDVSREIVERNQKLYGLPRVQFFPFTGSHLLPCDLLLCVDVLFHIIEDGDYYEMLHTLKEAKWRHLAVTAYEYDGPSSSHLRIRRFDPRWFGEPIVKEVIEEDGSLMFYVFER